VAEQIVIVQGIGVIFDIGEMTLIVIVVLLGLILAELKRRG
jgi:hypothetical protein